MQATSYADSSLSLEAVGPRGCRGAERGRKLPAPPHARAAVRKQALRLQNNRKQSMTRPASELKDIDEDEQERRDDEDTALDDQGQPIYTDVTHSFSVGNLNEWHDFLVHQMRLMQGIYSKKVLGKVLNMVENNQRRLYPYNSKKGHARSPPWWPEGLVYIGPDHQKTNGIRSLPYYSSLVRQLTMPL